MVSLQPGDVLVYKAGNHWLSKSIALITKSDVSHASLVIEGGKVVEMGAKGLAVSDFRVEKGEGQIALRFTDIDKLGTKPLIDAAQVYIKSKTRYDFPALVFIAFLLISREFRMTKLLSAVIDRIMQKAFIELDKIVQKLILKNADKAMVCSQLVYQVYEDCGKKYHIEIDSSRLKAAADLDLSADTGLVRLIDFLDDTPQLDMVLMASTDLPSDEELARELCDALTNDDELELMDMFSSSANMVISSSSAFYMKLKEILAKTQCNIPIDALFVTPADLAYKTKNLKTIGKLNVVYEEKRNGE